MEISSLDFSYYSVVTASFPICTIIVLIFQEKHKSTTLLTARDNTAFFTGTTYCHYFIYKRQCAPLYADLEPQNSYQSTKPIQPKLTPQLRNKRQRPKILRQNIENAALV